MVSVGEGRTRVPREQETARRGEVSGDVVGDQRLGSVVWFSSGSAATGQLGASPAAEKVEEEGGPGG